MWKWLLSCFWIIGLSLASNQPWCAAGERSSPPRAETTPLKLLMDWRPRAEYAGIILAEKKGFYRDAGLRNVKLQWSYPGDPVFPDLIDGRADFCTAVLAEAVIERNNNSPVVELSQIIQSSSVELVTKRTSGIVRLEDINGRRAAMWNEADDYAVQALFLQRGIRPTVVPLSFSLAVFLRGAVDAATVRHFSGYNTLLLSGLRPEDLRVFRMADYGFDLPEDGLFCLESTRIHRARDCAAVVAAIRRGWEYALSHEEEALDIILAYCEEHDAATNRSHQRWMLRVMGEIMRTPPGRPWGSLDPEAYRRVGEVLKTLKLIEKPPPYEDFFRPPDIPTTTAAPSPPMR